jgi:hypothetical protein
MTDKDHRRQPGSGPYPTAEQLRRLAHLIHCEDDYLNEERFVVQFAAAVLALWGSGGYVHRTQPTDRQLALLEP